MLDSDTDVQGAFPTYAQLLERPGKLRGTAWGLWGERDQLGTLNHLSADRVRAALGTVIAGTTIPLNLSLKEFAPPLIAHRGVLEHTIFGLNEFHRDDRLDSFFPQSSTQIDGLRHFAHPDHGFYNGFPGDEIVAETDTLGIQVVAERGIAGRGVLIDVARYRESLGKPIDGASSEWIEPGELDATLEFQGTSLEVGDIVMIRLGWLRFMRHVDRSSLGDVVKSPGLAQTEAMAQWLWNSKCALVAADNIALEAWPASPDSEIRTEAERVGSLEKSSHTGMLHRILIPLLGMTIGELWDLDALADACAERGSYECFVTAQPLNVPGGVGSPANVLAIV